MEIITDIPYQKASRCRSWLTIEQVENEHWEVMKKICDVLFTPNKYSEQAVSFARNILNFLTDWEYITWKQYDSVMKIMSNEEMSNLYQKAKKASELSQTDIGYLGPLERSMFRRFIDGMDEKYLGSGRVPFDVDIFGNIHEP